MASQSRVRLARRHAGLTQSQLAQAVGVQRSAVSHWESAQGRNPGLANLRQVALVTCVQFEWLASGRGKMVLCEEMQLDSIAAADALLVDDALELRLLLAFRNAPPRSRVSVVEIVEQLAAQRVGRGRKRIPSPEPTSRRGLRQDLMPMRATASRLG